MSSNVSSIVEHLLGPGAETCDDTFHIDSHTEASSATHAFLAATVFDAFELGRFCLFRHYDCHHLPNVKLCERQWQQAKLADTWVLASIRQLMHGLEQVLLEGIFGRWKATDVSFDVIKLPPKRLLSYSDTM